MPETDLEEIAGREGNDLKNRLKEVLEGENAPLFIRGTSVEEALYLLGKDDDLMGKLEGRICLWPSPFGFERIKQVPPKPIPDSYQSSLALVGGATGFASNRSYVDFLRYQKGWEDEIPQVWPEGAQVDESGYNFQRRLGVIIGFNERLLDMQPRPDSWFEDQDADMLYAVEVDFTKVAKAIKEGRDVVSFIIPIGPDDAQVLAEKANILSSPLFQCRNELDKAKLPIPYNAMGILGSAEKRITQQEQAIKRLMGVLGKMIARHKKSRVLRVDV